MSDRDNWDEYFNRVAEVVATRATCPRKKVGAVIVRDRTILTTGYNGSPRGLPHCTDVGCDLQKLGDRESCVRTIHAEANAVFQAAREGVRLPGSTLYCTASPCYDCTKMLLNVGITRIVIKEFYDSRFGKSGESLALAKKYGIEVVIGGNSE